MTKQKSRRKNWSLKEAQDKTVQNNQVKIICIKDLFNDVKKLTN